MLYDQIGCGRSQHLPDAPKDFWTVELFRRELTALIEQKGWDITPRLPDVDVPVLVISGEHDEATPTVVRPLVDALPDARWELIEGASHSTHLEQPERFLEIVETFLSTHD